MGLGANLGDAAATLAAAVAALAALPGVQLRGVSRLYLTAPVGVIDQPPFHNAVAALDAPTGESPATGAMALLIALKQLERAFGRRAGRRWGPRELDLDLLLFGRARLHLDRVPAARPNDSANTTLPLVVPHPEASERLFVLAPLAELAAGLVPPGWHERVSTARDRRAAVEGADAARPVARWAGSRGWQPLDG